MFTKKRRSGHFRGRDIHPRGRRPRYPLDRIWGGSQTRFIIIIIIKLHLGWHPVAVVYIYTHKQYTEYKGRNTHNNYKKKKQLQEKNWEINKIG
jgi:hypothetical protein